MASAKYSLGGFENVQVFVGRRDLEPYGCDLKRAQDGRINLELSLVFLDLLHVSSPNTKDTSIEIGQDLGLDKTLS